MGLGRSPLKSVPLTGAKGGTPPSLPFIASFS